jgi:hypothetical protein
MCSAGPTKPASSVVSERKKVPLVPSASEIAEPPSRRAAELEVLSLAAPVEGQTHGAYGNEAPVGCVFDTPITTRTQ